MGAGDYQVRDGSWKAEIASGCKDGEQHIQCTLRMSEEARRLVRALVRIQIGIELLREKRSLESFLRE